MLPRKSFTVLVLLTVSEVKCMTLNDILDFSTYLEKTSLIDKPKIDGVTVEGEAAAAAEETSDEDDPPSADAWERSGKFEGDLVLSARQRRLIVEDVAEGLSRNGLKDITKRWPNNELIYYIQKEHFSSGQVQAIMAGLEDIARSSCIRFRPYKKGDRDAVVIVGNRRGCFSAVGYQSGYQVLNLSARHPLGRGCFRHGTVVHEMLHSLGFYHMQSSPDRDDYIHVNWDNIIEGAKHNFRKYNTFSVSDFGVPYDYESVLHYSKKAFSKNGQLTLVPKKGGAEIGQRRGMSNADVEKLNKMYCDAGSDSVEDVKETRKKSASLKKKSNNNKPFEGHGLGYYQGKSVIVKLPKLETIEIKEHSNEYIPYISEHTPTSYSDRDKTSESSSESASPQINHDDNSDEVFVDMSKLLSGIGTNHVSKPSLEGFLVNKDKGTASRDHSGETTNKYPNYRESNEPRKPSAEDYNSARSTVTSTGPSYDDYQYFDLRNDSEKRTLNTYPSQDNISSDLPIGTGYTYGDYSGYNAKYSPENFSAFSSEGIKNQDGAKSNKQDLYLLRNNEKLTYNERATEAPSRITYDDYILHSEPESATKGIKHLDEDFTNVPTADSTEIYFTEDFDLHSIPDSVKDWFGSEFGS